METRKDYIVIFLLILLLILAIIIVSFYFEEIYLALGLAVVLAGAGAFFLGGRNRGKLAKIIGHIENINLMEFTKDKELSLPMEMQACLEELAQGVRGNLKSQVESSTRIFHICEKLNAVSQESLASAETIAASVATADSNTVDQANMLNESSHLANRVYSSLKSMEGDMLDKIEFISNTINLA